ncbi:Nodulin-like protein [Novymonas esmeraldas]|uniref:Nodulin-like protein n=1 Tax=Novymonas esmeraldas TaxID=1808958 RepID=A0AAW0EM46_9TRYP
MADADQEQRRGAALDEHLDANTRADAGGLDAEAKEAVNQLDTHNVKRLSELMRFVRLSAAAFAMICASTSYSFNLFSGNLQKTYNYDSRQMSTINSVGMVFAYFLMPYGFICDYFGPFPIYCIATTFFSLGALLMGLTFQGVVHGSVVRFCVFNALLSLGSQLFDLATVTSVISIFPTRKGWCIALLKTLMGLGSAIIASIQTGFFITSPANYFYFLIALVVVVASCVMVLVRLPAYHLTGYEQSHLSEEEKERRMKHRVAYLTQEPPMWRFYFGIAIILVLVAYLPTTSAVVAFANVGLRGKQAFAIVAIVVTLLLLLMMVPFPLLDRLTTRQSTVADDAERAAGDTSDPMEDLGLPQEKRMSTSSSSSSAAAAAAGRTRTRPFGGDDLGRDDLQMHCEGSEKAAPRAGPVRTDVDYIAPQYQTTFLQSCCTLRFWCIFWTMFCGLGSEFVIIFNARFIYQALDGAPIDPTVSALLTVLNGAGSALGRLAMSAFEMYTQQQAPERRTPLTAAFFVPTTFVIISMVLFLVLPGRALLLAYAIAALGNGFCASITILVLRTIYAKDPAKHYNFSINALVPASILLNRLLYGEWYAVQADKQGSKVCYGRKCVMMPLLVMIGINLSAFASTLYVHFSYMRFCRKVLAERRRLQECGAPQVEDAPLGNSEKLAA